MDKSINKVHDDVKRLGEQIKAVTYELAVLLDCTDIRKLSADQAGLMDMFSKLQGYLDDADYEISYYNRPVKAEGRLEENQNGRYCIGEYEISSGNIIEILVADNDDCYRWSKCRIAHDKGEYYAIGIGSDLGGMMARIR